MIRLVARPVRSLMIYFIRHFCLLVFAFCLLPSCTARLALHIGLTGGLQRNVLVIWHYQ